MMPVYFPITPHLRGSRGTHDDTFMDEATTQRVLSSEVIVQEKVDGMNVGIGFETGGVIRLVKKDKLITWEAYPVLEPLQRWVDEHFHVLYRLCGEQFYLFGEFVSIVSLPLPWFVFDMYNIQVKRFMTYDYVRAAAARLNLPIVPMIYSGKLHSLEFVSSLITRSTITGEQMEGIYIRHEESPFLRERYKFVRADYVKPESSDR